MHVIKCHSYYWGCKTNDCWKAVASNFQEGVGCILLSLYSKTAANTLFMTVCNLSPPRLPKIHNQQSLTLHSPSFSGCGLARVPVHFDHEGGQHITNKQWHTIVSIFWLTVAYSTAKINSETLNPEPEIGTNRLWQTWQNLRVDGYRSVFGLQSIRGLGVWMNPELNWSGIAVHILTGGRLLGRFANTHSQ